LPPALWHWENVQALVVVVQLAANGATRAIKRCLLYATIIASVLGTMSCIILMLLLRSFWRRELILINIVHVKLSKLLLGFTKAAIVGVDVIFKAILKVGFKTIAMAHLVRSFQNLKSPAKTNALLQLKQADPPLLQRLNSLA
jgi:hypothetical protein